MKFFAAITTAMAFATAIAAPLTVDTTPTTSLEQREINPNQGITVFHSKSKFLGRTEGKFRIMGFLRVTGAMFEILKERMGEEDAADSAERASVISTAYFAHFRSWLGRNLAGSDLTSLRTLFNRGTTGGAEDVAWEGTIGVQFNEVMNDDIYNRLLALLQSYLSPAGSDPVPVTFQAVDDAFAIGSPSQYQMPAIKARAAGTCSDTMDLTDLFVNQTPALPDLLGSGC
ncbi:hypothetical protein SLS56_007086 [Neofusicoccum ribis]|uniref:Uncharacterized protein n=1 Tax=Neofusicoccum ribis TaxID=45134 RepID=A0ABR3SPG1_9PEZI